MYVCVLLRAPTHPLSPRIAANQLGTQIYPVCVNNAWRVQIFYEGGLCLRDVTGFLYADDVT
jgi:hypothetical protein